MRGSGIARRASLALALLAGCTSQTESVPVDRWSFEGEAHELPLRLSGDALERDQSYRLDARVELPDALRGEALDLSIPWFQARVRVEAEGRALAAASEGGRADDYRATQPQRWRIPATLTEDGTLDLSLEVDHRWTQSGWLTTTPALVRAGEPDPRATRARRVNLHGSLIALAGLLQIGLTCLLVYGLDRRRRPYLWFGIQALSASIYPAFIAGLTPALFGVWDVVAMEIGLVVALIASFHFTHSYYQLGPVPRWLVGLLAGAGLLSLVCPSPYLATQVVTPAVVASVVVGTVYQLVTLARLYVKEPERRVSIGLLTSAWLALAAGTWADLVGWLGIAEPLEGTRPAGIGLAFFGLFLSLLLSRSHIRSLARSAELNTALGHKLDELEDERARVLSLNEELRERVADRSGQLFSALSLIQKRGREATQLAAGFEVDGRYRVEEVLGAGAMGMVYAVTRLEDRSRWAMKVTTGVSGEDLARLAREAHIASRVDHPNVVSIRDIDISSFGFLYIVLELVEGESLRARLSGGPLGPREAIPILLQIARGLVALHEAGVAHRDLKPDNVLLSGRGEALVAKITDFGISRMSSFGIAAPEAAMVGAEPEDEDQHEHADHDEVTAVVTATGSGSDLAAPGASGSGPLVTPSNLELTGTGMLAGTPHYVAPELALGAPKTDVRADLFSFGVLAYELLTKRRPFAVAVALSLRLGDQAVEREPLGLPSEWAALEELILTCLLFEPERRPSAPEVCTWLTELADVRVPD